MAKSGTKGFKERLFIRMNKNTIRRVDKAYVKMQGEHPGLTISKSAFVRLLILRGLEARDQAKETIEVGA